MGGVLGDIVDSVTDVFDDVVDFVSDAAKDLVELAEDAAKFLVDATMTITGLKWVDEQLTGGLVYNTLTGVVDNVGGMLVGAIEGDWVQFRDAAMGTVTTAVALSAIVAGAVTGQWWAVAAGVAVLDAQYNEGELLRRAIDVVAGIETAVFNTHYIEEYSAEIQMLITVAASIGAGYVGAPYLIDVSGIGAITAQWASELAMIQNVVSAGYGVYQIYSAVQAIRDSQAYWEEQLREAEAYYRNLIAQANAARNLWFDMFTNPDIINRIMPGGDLYLMGAGHDLVSITSVAEPKYALGLIDKSDPEMDRLVNNRFYASSAGSDTFKPQ